MSATVYLSLGSNVGDRARNLSDAIAALPAAEVNVTKLSSFYETEPVDYLEQAWFVNCAVEAKTDLAPSSLLPALARIEEQMGRKKLAPKGPRLIDIDILLYGDQNVDTAELQVPHPRMHLRRFVLLPLAEIAPGARHPLLHLSVAELLQRVQDPSQVRLLRGHGSE